MSPIPVGPAKASPRSPLAMHAARQDALRSAITAVAASKTGIRPEARNAKDPPLRPVPKSRDLGTLPHRDDPGLMPRQSPVRTLRFVKQNRPHGLHTRPNLTQTLRYNGCQDQVFQTPVKRHPPTRARAVRQNLKKGSPFAGRQCLTQPQPALRFKVGQVPGESAAGENNTPNCSHQITTDLMVERSVPSGT